MKFWVVKLAMFYCLIFIALFSLIQSDIPTHCLKSQIVGEWVFKRTPAVPRTLNELYKLENLCGHKLPSHESTSLNANSLNEYETKEDLRITLNSDDSALFNGAHNGQIGQWTMVYDEGFDVTINRGSSDNQISYFTFLKYDFKKPGSNLKSKYASYCNVTLNGWYHIGNKWGCFQGYKITPDGNYNIETNGEAENKQNITEELIEAPLRTSSFASSSLLSDNYGSSANNQGLTTVLNDQLNIHRLNSNSNDAGSIFSSDFSNIDSYKTPEYVSNINTSGSNTEFLNFKFTQTLFKEKLTLHAEFKDHAKFVERINASEASWTATVYKEFEGKTIAELNSFAGKNKTRSTIKDTNNNNSQGKSMFLLSHSGSSSVRTKTGLLRNIAKRRKSRNTNKTVDFSNLMGDARSQGSCGSCFAASTLSMLESRLRKKYDEVKSDSNFSISLAHVLECSVYNQGCDGGYSYLVLKFANENELLHNKCYTNGNNCVSSCSNDLSSSRKLRKDSNSNKKIKVTDYYYVGGSYGKCDEQSMIDELEANGPFVVSFEPSYDFMHYQSGIFESKLVKKNWKNSLEKIKPEWQKVDHSVVLVGYGEENGIKFWKLQNSWGKTWGEGGYFRMLRGTDHIGIESICEAGNISLQ